MGMLRAVPVGAALSLGISLPLMWAEALLRREFFLLAGVLILGGAFLGAILGFLWPASPLQVARHVERVFGLKERLSTALEWQARREHPLYTHLQEDARRAAARVNSTELLAFRLPAWHLWLSLVLLTVTAVTGSLRLPFARAAAHRQERQAIQSEFQAIETLRQEIAARDDLTPEEKSRLDEILAQAGQELAQTQSSTEASAALEEARQKLKTLSPEQAQTIAEALQNAGQQLSTNADSPLQSTGQALAQGNLLQAAQALGALDVRGMDASQREALAGQLNAMAQSLAESNPDLAAQLQQAAQALQNGDAAAAQQALAQAAQRLNATARQLQQAAAAQQLSAQLGQGQQRLLATGQGATGSSQGQGAGTQQGNGQTNNGSSLWNGQSPGGAGSGAGSGESQAGGETGNQPMQPNTLNAHNGESPYEPLSAADPRLGGGEGTITLPGSDASGNFVGEGGTNPAENGTLQVPYEDVLPQYLDAYRQAIEDERIPSQLRDVIREYFGSLEP
ncbi:MAG: hypothetical protein Fur0018_19850 [Anaerolineales bacterium]